MDLKVIHTYEQLDEIMPLMDELHEQQKEYYSMFATMGFYAWISALFPSNLKIWVGYDNDVPVGYLMVGTRFVYGKKEAVIYEAYCRGNTDMVEECWGEFMDWVNIMAYDIVSCYTTRGKAIARKYGFSISQSYLTKEI